MNIPKRCPDKHYTKHKESQAKTPFRCLRCKDTNDHATGLASNDAIAQTNRAKLEASKEELAKPAGQELQQGVEFANKIGEQKLSQ